MNDVIATEMVKQLTRIADSLHALVAKQNQVQAPNLFRAIEDYPAFQWETEIPGCKIIARDKNGPTEVAYEGHTYRRYRSSEDDSKGIDIRYRCVVSGTVAEKNMVWASLIKFGEPKKSKLIWRPQNTIVVDDEAGEKILKLIGNLEDNDDVQNVYANFEISDALMQKMQG